MRTGPGAGGAFAPGKRSSCAGLRDPRFGVGGRAIAGIAPPLEEAPPHWNVYFNVVDADESVAQAEALGAKLIVPPYQLEGSGRMASLTDPQGALFCLLQA